MADDAVDKIVIQIVAEGGDQAKDAMDGAGKGAEVLGREVDRLNKRIDELTGKMREAIRANNDFSREMIGTSGASRGTPGGNAKIEIERQYNLLQEGRRLEALNRQRSREGNRDFGDQQRASESLRNQREAAYNKQASDEYKNSPQFAQENRQQQWQSHFQRFRVAGASDKDSTIGANQIMAERAKAAAKELELLGRNAASTSPAWKAIREGFDMLGEGATRRGFSHAITGVIGGDDPGVAAKLIGGFGGTLASSLFMPIAWGIGNMLAELPRMIAKEQSSQTRLYAGEVSSPLGSDMLNRYKSNRVFWAGAMSNGSQEWLTSAEYMQNAGMSPRETEAWTNRLALLQAGSPDGKNLGGAFAAMHRTHTNESKSSFVFANQEVKEYLENAYLPSSVPTQSRDAVLREKINRGDFGVQDIEDATSDVAILNKRNKQKAEGEAGGIGGIFSRVKESLWKDISTPPWQRLPFGYTPIDNLTSDLWNSRSAGAMNGLSGDMIGAHKLHPERGGFDFSFHSASTLAEDMQRSWSGPGADSQTQMADDMHALRTLAENGGIRVYEPTHIAPPAPAAMK